MLIIIFFTVNRHKSAVHLECIETQGSSSLIAINKYAQKGIIKDGQTAFFKFSPHQLQLLSSVYEKYSTTSITVRINLLPKKNKEHQNGFLKFGFLTEKDFTKSSKKNLVNISDSSHPLIQANLDNAPQIFDISLAAQKQQDIKDYQKNLPKGFFISSDYDCKIVAACAVPSEMGFDINYEVPFYGFAGNGGYLDFSNNTIDFSGASLVFPVENTSVSSMPEFAITLDQTKENKSTLENKVLINFTLGGEKFSLNNVKTDSQIIIPSSALKSPFSRAEITQNSDHISSFILRATYNQPNSEGQVLIPVRTDPGLILNYNKSAWRTLDYEIFEWDRFERILFFDTRNYDIQDNFFKRMAYFVEKEGYKGTLLTNEQLQGKHGYNAHDYSAVSMANFFNKALQENFTLNKEEEILKKILLENDLIEFDGTVFIPNEGGIVSISQESAPYLRSTFLAHEGWHTLFFKDEEFRNFTSAVYYTMDQTSIQFLKDYFKSQPGLGYDQNDDYLMHNEFMAYIMQQNISEVSKYFVHLANRGSVIKYTPKLAAYVRNTEGKTFEDAALALNDFVFDKYQIIGGNITLISKN
ncbi:MAG: hypothetical protein PUJ82_04185 [Spirochaetales bacterium]|nr:hypothetical protein [Spirochaetales bacterium]MDY5914120.1 hypothetical protein [Treponema sp.]